jgi:hypothetical protein
MALASYDDLTALLPDLLTRTDATTALMEGWITLAEARIGRELRVDQMLTRATATLNAEFGTVPTDFAAPKSMRLSSGSKRLLQYLTIEQMTELQTATDGGGDTIAYTRVGGEFWFFPPPGAADDGVELIYYAKIPPLTSADPTNWLMTAYPDLYIRGTMVEAALYYEDQELLGTYSQLFTDSIRAIEAASQRDAMAANINPTPSAFPV